MKVDLHTHTSVSDGKISPSELVLEAESVGIDLLSITDHDTIKAYEGLQSGSSASVHLIPGIEFSTEWRKTGIHILGLNIRLDSDAIRAGIKIQTQARTTRAQRIADKLDKLGIEDSWEIAGESVIGRPHFARFLVESGVVKNTGQAFDKYLGAGKTGDVRQFWAPYGEIIQWIRDADGTAVLAHPDKYKMSRTKLLSLLDDFQAAGGEAMEVITGNQSKDVTQKLSLMCQGKGLMASCGSDFHQPGQPWAQLGRVAPLPSDCKAIWESWVL
jgi:predicted metal-dependent phosphoesterase TrpH